MGFVQGPLDVSLQDMDNIVRAGGYDASCVVGHIPANLNSAHVSDLDQAMKAVVLWGRVPGRRVVYVPFASRVSTSNAQPFTFSRRNRGLLPTRDP